MKKHNFNAGPCILPQVALENTAKAVLDLDGIGLSLITISHRSKEFQAIIDETEALWMELLNIPAGYKVLFLGGGASTQFCMVPYNLMKTKAAYVETGVWAKKAAKEAKLFGKVEVIASSADKNIYGGAQKNVGPAGVTFVIVKEDILGKVDRQIPSMLDYRTHVDKGSMYNTPSCFAIYTMREVLKWVKAQGGVKAMEKLAIERAKVIYDEIDRNKMFVGTVEPASRSRMNICFVMAEKYKDKEEAFLEFAKSQGMVGIKGHRDVGGFRASAYNALPMESAKALVACMQEFEKKNA